jgi:uncharacterized protein
MTIASDLLQRHIETLVEDNARWQTLIADDLVWELRVYAFADPEAAVAEVKAEALIKPTGRIYRQEYVVFLRAAGGKIAFLREYFDPTRAAKALDTPILGLES